jgi:hypothetical protein
MYIDTNILLSLSKYDKVDKDVFRSMTKEFYQKDIKIPQIVLGEALTIILEKTTDKNKIPECLDNLKETLFKLKCTPDKFPTTNNAVIKCAAELEQISDVVNHMDSLILAHPMMDDDATHFYTKDERLKNPRVHDYVRSLIQAQRRTQELNIPADFTEE